MRSKHHARRTLTLLVAAGALGLASTPRAAPDDQEPTLRTVVRAKSALRVRRVTGAVQDDVQGVPAAPVNSFNYDGNGVESVRGRIVLDVDPIANQGRVRAQWTDEHGDWTLRVERFTAPHHPSGLRIAPDAGETKLVYEDPIVTDVSLHGNTLAGQPVLPTVHALLAAWGQAAVTLNGAPFDNPYDGSFVPLWEAHLMVTAGVRECDGTVRAEDGSIYNPMMHADQGHSDEHDLELHLTWHDAPYPEDPANFPPLFDFFYHLVFEDVVIRTKHTHVDGDQ